MSRAEKLSFIWQAQIAPALNLTPVPRRVLDNIDTNIERTKPKILDWLEHGGRQSIEAPVLRRSERQKSWLLHEAKIFRMMGYERANDIRDRTLAAPHLKHRIEGLTSYQLLKEEAFEAHKMAINIDTACIQVSEGSVISSLRAYVKLQITPAFDGLEPSG